MLPVLYLLSTIVCLHLLRSCSPAGTGLRQSTNEVLMVAPTAFGFNDQAAQDNHFMHCASNGAGPASPGKSSVTHTVLREFAGLHHQLTEVSYGVSLFCHVLGRTSAVSLITTVCACTFHLGGRSFAITRQLSASHTRMNAGAWLSRHGFVMTYSDSTSLNLTHRGWYGRSRHDYLLTSGRTCPKPS